MGFFGLEEGGKKKSHSNRGVSDAFLHKAGCTVCPLNKKAGTKNPHLKPRTDGDDDQPLIYILTEKPTYEDDRRGTFGNGKLSRIIKDRMPKGWEKKIALRWNSLVRTYPGSKKTPAGDIPLAPDRTSIECCRPSIVEDIEKHKPEAIFGFGNEVLRWVLGYAGITDWAGRRIPIRIGKHECWFYPVYDPVTVLEKRRFEPRGRDDITSEYEFKFQLDLKQMMSDAVADEIKIHSVEYAHKNCDIVTGEEAGDFDRVMAHIKAMHKEPAVGLDYETNGKRPYALKSKILTVALAGKKESLAFAIDHPGAMWSKVERKAIKRAYVRFLMEHEGTKAVHQLSFEMEWTGYKFGTETLRASRWDDSISQAYILDERKLEPQGLGFLCLQYFGLDIKTLSNVDRKNLENTDVKVVLRYNAIDAKYHRLLFLRQKRRLHDEDLQDVYEAHLRRVPTMVLTQLSGVPVDQEVVASLYEEYSTELKAAEKEIQALPEYKKFRQMVGHDFMPSNPNDVKKMAERVLKLKIDTTQEKELTQHKHPMITGIFRYRKAAKIISTYIKPVAFGLSELEDSPHIGSDMMLHPIISTTKTETWRTSSEEPNQQNWPKRGEGRRVRSQVRHPKRNIVCVAFDYAGIQARNIAMESKDRALVEAYFKGYDIHSVWLENIAKRFPKWIDGGTKKLQDKTIQKAYRSKAKNEFVFPAFFGAKPNSLSRYLQIPPDVCEDLLAQLWHQFPDIHKWHKRILKFYRQNGYVTGHSGFRRRAPISPNQLINAPIQADESLIVCDAMATLSEMEDPRYQATMEIHDDLTFFWPKKEIERNSEVVVKAMLEVNYDWINVPLGVEMSVGSDWSNIQEVAAYESHKWDGEIKQVNWEVLK